MLSTHMELNIIILLHWVGAVFMSRSGLMSEVILPDITLIIIEIMVDVRNDNYISDITRNHHYDSDITLSIVKIMVDVGNDN